VHYIPNTHYALYRNCRGDVPVCERVWQQLLTLPLFPDLADDEVETIVGHVRAFQPAAMPA
jgi:perosamine synthetase